MDILTVPTLSVLYALKNCKDGEIAYVEENEQSYSYENGEWILHFFDEGNTTTPPKMDLYSLNKMLMEQVKPLNEDDIKLKKLEIREYIDFQDNYSYMLLCKDLDYYTVFLKNSLSDENMEDVVIECLNYLGKIKSIDYDKDNEVVEVWVENEGDHFVAFFFGYDGGIVPCK